MPPPRSTPKILHRAAELRQSPTPAEQKLWAQLRLMRKDGVHFRRQHAIGRFVTDFCAPRRKLIIELDGSQHREQDDYDQQRIAFLTAQGYRVMRFWNGAVLNDIDGVMDAIQRALGEGS